MSVFECRGDVGNDLRDPGGRFRTWTQRLIKAMTLYAVHEKVTPPLQLAGFKQSNDARVVEAPEDLDFPLKALMRVAEAQHCAVHHFQRSPPPR